MTPLLVELDLLLTQGVEFVESGELETTKLLDWLSQRGRLFTEIDRATGQLGGAARNSLECLIKEILKLDTTIIPKAEAAMRRVGAEIAAVQKLKKFVAGGVKPVSHSLLRRAL